MGIGSSLLLNGWQLQVQKAGDEWEPACGVTSRYTDFGPSRAGLYITSHHIRSHHTRPPSRPVTWPDFTPWRLLNGLSEKPLLHRDPPQSPGSANPGRCVRHLKTSRYHQPIALVLYRQKADSSSRRLTVGDESGFNTKTQQPPPLLLSSSSSAPGGLLLFSWCSPLSLDSSGSWKDSARCLIRRVRMIQTR